MSLLPGRVGVSSAGEPRTDLVGMRNMTSFDKEPEVVYNMYDVTFEPPMPMPDGGVANGMTFFADPHLVDPALTEYWQRINF